MRPTVLLLALLAVVLATPAQAAPPDSIPQAQEQADVDLAPADEAVVVDQQPVAEAIAPHSHLPGSYGGHGHLDPQAGRKCQCAQYFGGYGPLWDTYCYERHLCQLRKGARCRGCRDTAACGPGCSPGVQPLFGGKRLQGSCACCDQPSCHKLRLRRPLRRKACHASPGCDCTGPATKEIQLDITPGEIGAPPAPDAPEENQVAPPPPVNVEASTGTSSRRGWTAREAGLLPDR